MRVWIDLRNRALASIYISDPAPTQVVVRRVLLPDGLDDVAREQLAQIVGPSVASLAQGERIGSPPSVIARQTPPRRSSRWDIGVGYGLGFWREGLALHGPTALLGAELGRGTIQVDARYRFPATTSAGDVRARIHQGALRVSGGLRFPLSRVLAGRFSLGAGAELTSIAPREGSRQGAMLAARSQFVDPFVSSTLIIEYAPSSRWSARLEGGAEFFFVDRRFTQNDTGTTTVALRPWRVRPSMSLGFTVRLGKAND